MRERLNRADSKSVELFLSSVGSNPTLSVLGAGYRIFNSRRDDREAKGARLESVCTLTGYRGFESLSLRIPLALMIRPYAISRCPNPSGPEGSSGKHLIDET